MTFKDNFPVCQILDIFATRFDKTFCMKHQKLRMTKLQFSMKALVQTSSSRFLIYIQEVNVCNTFPKTLL